MSRSRIRHRTVLVLHLLSIAAWFGADVVIAALVVTAAVSGPLTAGVALSAIGLFAVPVLTVAGLATLASGIALGVSTGIGVTRRWWVVAKLAITLLLTALVPIGLVGAVASAARVGRALIEGATTEVAIGNLAYPPIVSPVLLIVAVVLAVVRPWGRTPWARSSEAAGREHG